MKISMVSFEIKQKTKIQVRFSQSILEINTEIDLHEIILKLAIDFYNQSPNSKANI